VKLRVVVIVASDAEGADIPLRNGPFGQAPAGDVDL
jgi:hypothetical protein